MRSITTDKFALLGVRTKLPPAVRFPLSKSSDSFQQGLVEFLFGTGLVDKFKGVVRLVKAGL